MNETETAYVDRLRDVLWRISNLSHLAWEDPKNTKALFERIEWLAKDALGAADAREAKPE